MMIHDDYKLRANCENLIEEAKNQLALAHIHTDNFWANEILFQCSILAFNVVHWMRALSDDPILMKWEAKTVRTCSIRVA
jgi:hypothetical protein